MLEFLLGFVVLGSITIVLDKAHRMLCRWEDKVKQQSNVKKDNKKGNEEFFVKEDVPFSTELNTMLKIKNVYDNKLIPKNVQFLIFDETIRESNTESKLNNIVLYFKEDNRIPTDIQDFFIKKQTLLSHIFVEANKLAEMKNNSSNKLSTVSQTKMENMYYTFVLLINELDMIIKKQEEYEKTEWENLVSLTK